MMGETLLERWLEYYDPLHRGWTAAGIANAVCATNGYSFPRIKGGYNLRRRMGATPDLSDPIVGAAGHDATSVRTFPWVGHDSGAAYVYRLSAVSGGGVEDAGLPVVAEVAIDETGAWAGLRPTAPGDLAVEALSQGRFAVRWTFIEHDGAVLPAVFRVYHDGGSGSIDFQTPAGEVARLMGKLHYAFVSGSFPHGTAVRWAVRAVSAGGVEERNTRAVRGRAASAGPGGVPMVRFAVS
jgi:hypothetical protein